MRINGFKLSGPIILLIIMKLILSCAPESCIEETTAFVKTTFYRSTTNKLTAPDSITVYGIGKETIRLYSRATNINTIKLPLDASSESCGFIIKVNNLTDTLRLVYTSYPHLISKACGYTFFYSLNSFLISGILADTVIIRNKNITTFNEENIRIYY